MSKFVNINEPIVWETYDNIKIMDIHPDQFKTVQNIAMLETKSNQLLFHNATIQGAILQYALDDLLNIVGVLLQDRTSLIAIDESTNEIIGTAILKVMDTNFHAWTQILKIPQTVKLQAVFNVTHYMLKNYNESKDDKCYYCLHCFFLCSNPNYCGFKLKTKLLLAAERVAASMRIPYLTTVPFTYNNQIRMLRAGMKEGYRVYYALYKDDNGNRPFDIILKREWYCIFFIKNVVPQIRYTEL